MERKLYLTDAELTASRGNIPALNGLRAISILIVTISHMGLQQQIPGWFGVNVFFFLSGFLISRLLIAEREKFQSINIRLFYLRRFFRLFPALLCLLLCCIVISLAQGVHIKYYAVISVIFYFANYVRIFAPDALQQLHLLHTWSLSIEEHFYFIYPLLLTFCFSRRLSVIPFIFLGIVLAFVFRMIDHFWFPSFATVYVYNASETRMDFLLFGALAAFICHGSHARTFLRIVSDVRVFGAAIVLLISTFMIKSPIFRDVFRFTLQNVALLVVVPSLVFGEKYLIFKRILNHPVMDWIGRISYSLYLFQVPVFEVIDDWALTWPLASPFNVLAGYGLGFGLSFAAAAISYYFVEGPVLVWRRRLQRGVVEGVA